MKEISRRNFLRMASLTAVGAGLAGAGFFNETLGEAMPKEKERVNMAKGNLGFGWMRLPLKSADSKDIDLMQVSQMVDEYMAAGYNYFDTSFVYHDGKSENAIRECLVKRKPRESFILASKLPTFIIKDEQQVIDIFHQQLANCGVDYFDYFLLHNLNVIRYDDEVKNCHMFEHLKKWQAEGKIRHIAFSFHDTADVLDRILTEHPEVEAVQIVVNYLDWDARLIQAHKCYETIRKHGRDVLIMEPVKGGLLAKAPKEAEKLMKEAQPGKSIASWGIRFAGELDGVLSVISGMSSLEQVRDNVATMQEFEQLSEREKEILHEVSRIYQENGPAGTADFSAYEMVNPKGISAATILETWNNCMIQPVPGFAAEQNYFTSEKAKHGIPMEESCLPEKVITADGRNITAMAKEAEKFLMEHGFFRYEVKETAV